jgi:hypothetical protein
MDLWKRPWKPSTRCRPDGVIGQYAIGGAVGATLYLEPAATLDVDIFVTLPAVEGGSLLTRSPIYDYLRGHGGTVEHEHIVVGGWPVRFLPPANELEREAIAEAVEATVQGVSTRVMTAEHMVAIAMKTARAKDNIRILHFIEQKAVIRGRINEIPERHGLVKQWREFARRHLEENRG